ncbi:ABC transporter substrate-binding protein [Psychrobacillus sp. MER TA 171]|uniref:ABC transporter substrate-binding protein n=1 Tax=Psychrobacillus sp. MER TA 171 TaxID=2939577 RepID=UPI00203A5C4E|nr:ABC transporter substrate-binding protein [Psychrobacillus sp. MER TA 171]MCM3356580.1 ABC transporter substrate-binding protein [Psychrobacillus sp. MER TA 171]
MKKWVGLASSVLLTVGLLVACSGDDSSTSTSTTKKEDDRTLTIAMGTDMVTFDVHNHVNTSTEAIHVNMFNYLFKRDNETGEILPDLAEGYEKIDDKTWEVKLKEGVKFHNGEALDSEDVKFSLERVAHDSTLLDHINYNSIKEVQVVDELTLRIVTNEPDPALLNRISRIASSILPSEYIEENGMDHFLENPVGTGPFKFSKWVRDDRIVLEVYDDYFDGKNEEWDEVVFRVIPENSTRVSELLTGGVDIATNMPPSEWKRIDDNDGTHLSQGTSNRTMMIFVRSTEGYPTSDPRVRKALDLAIDNKAITDNLLNGAGIPTITRVAPGNFGFAEDLYDTYNYDVEEAKKLLAEAGYPDGFEMTFHSPKGRYLQDAEIAEMVAGMWTAIGVKANVEFMEWSSFVELRNSGKNKDAYLLALGNSMFDAANALDWYNYERFKGQIDYHNEEVEELLAAAAQNMDPEERAEQYIKAQHLLAEDTAHIVLHQESINVGVSDAIDYTPTMDEIIYVDSINKK